MNSVTLIGIVANELEFNNKCNNTNVKLEVRRSYPDEEGLYEIDCFDVKIYGEVATDTANYCKSGDLIAIKGYLQNQDEKTLVIAERVSILETTIINL